MCQLRLRDGAEPGLQRLDLGVLRVHLCAGCGTLSLEMGSLLVPLDRDAFHRFRRSLAEATASLEARPDTQARALIVLSSCGISLLLARHEAAELAAALPQAAAWVDEMACGLGASDQVH